jgi:hypothetical protein
VLVFDPSALPKSGRESVGVARQWCGRLGNVDTCHVAISLGYVSRKGHTLVDLRLYLPNAWTQEKARLQKAGVPKARRGDRTRHQWALEMREPNGAALPHAWMAGDDEMGRPCWPSWRPTDAGGSRARPPGIRPPPFLPGITARPRSSWRAGGWGSFPEFGRKDALPGVRGWVEYHLRTLHLWVLLKDIRQSYEPSPPGQLPPHHPLGS